MADFTADVHKLKSVKKVLQNGQMNWTVIAAGISLKNIKRHMSYIEFSIMIVRQ